MAPATDVCKELDYDRSPMAKSEDMQKRYDALVAEMKATHGFRVRRWRSAMTGCAWIVRYHNGEESRLIEAPYPRGPMSAAIFLHEVGHHAIGFRTYSPRCLEEYHAWRWSLEAMRERGLNVTEAVERRMAESLHYAVDKARRRGLKKIPVELLPYVQRPERKPKRRVMPKQTRRAAAVVVKPVVIPASPIAQAATSVRNAMRQLWLFGAGR